MSKEAGSTKSPSKKKASNSSDTVKVYLNEGDDPELKSAEAMIGPYVSNAYSFGHFMKGTIGDPKLDKLVTALMESAKRVKENDMRDVEALLVTQATVLNGMFADLTRRSAVNMASQYRFESAERYLKLAFKAQNQCRMTLETLSTIKNPPVVYARQANIANGPQQVNNGPVSATHAGENKNAPNKLLETTLEEPMDTRASGNAGAGNSAMAAVDKFHRAENT